MRHRQLVGKVKGKKTEGKEGTKIKEKAKTERFREG
jgi:hypothetical protein